MGIVSSLNPETSVPVGLSSPGQRSGNSMKFPYTRAPHTPHPTRCPSCPLKAES
ncbi:MAG: hypothetical protein F6J93_32490 [Oscillatoria sp. SIO1A7]|nr:hypothetical protein [Oscillatoria sp. SIO1A7]